MLIFRIHLNIQDQILILKIYPNIDIEDFDQILILRMLRSYSNVDKEDFKDVLRI